MNGRYDIIVGDCRDKLADLPAGHFHCCVTSPPYFGLRDYGTADWEGGDPACDHKPTKRGADRAFANGRGEVGDDWSGKSLTSWTHRDATVKQGGDCPRCGATRIDRQIGLEPTPDDFVNAIVEVFRGVWRVLRDDGVAWLNLGDSYLNKQKQFIPERTALALQSPFYSGRIKSDHDRAWLAAIIDGEGCLYIHKRKTGGHAGGGVIRKADTYSAALGVYNTKREIVERCAEIAGVGSIREKSDNRSRRRPCYEWNVRSNEARNIVAEIYPHLIGKQHEARIVYGCPPSGNIAALCHESMLLLRRDGDVDYDLDAPPNMFSPGWFVRDSIIWAKPAPMPGSQRDRCTSSYEFVFQLTKSARYFFDLDAIKEPFADERNGDPGAYSRTPAEHKGCNRSRQDMGFIAGGGGWDGESAGGRTPRNIWKIASEGFSEAHFATFPRELPTRCIKAATSERGCCAECGAPWERVTERTARKRERPNDLTKRTGANGTGNHCANTVAGVDVATTGWQPTCKCESTTRPARVLDPFNGAGTTGLAACLLGRDYTGIELSPDYAEMARKRIARELNPSTFRDYTAKVDAPLFTGAHA